MIDNLYIDAKDFYQNQKYDKAARKIQELIKLDSTNIDFLILHSKIESQRRNRRRAITILNDAKLIEPENFNIPYNLAILEYENESLIEALIHIYEAIELSPNNLDNLLLASKISFEIKEYSEAKHILDTALEIEPDNTKAIFQKGLVTFENIDKQKGIDLVEKALKKDSKNNLFRCKLGWMYLEIGNRQNSIDNFQTVISLDPNSQEGKKGLVEALKSKYVIFRTYRRYNKLLIKNNKNRKWAITLFCFGLLSLVAKPSFEGIYESKLRAILTSLLIAYMFYNWIIEPLGLIYLSNNKIGREILNKNESNAAKYLTFFSILTLITILTFGLTNRLEFLLISIFCLTMLLPISHYYDDEKEENTFKVLAWLLGIVGILEISIFIMFSDVNIGWLFPYVALYIYLMSQTAKIMMNRIYS